MEVEESVPTPDRMPSPFGMLASLPPFSSAADVSDSTSRYFGHPPPPIDDQALSAASRTIARLLLLGDAGIQDVDAPSQQAAARLFGGLAPLPPCRTLVFAQLRPPSTAGPSTASTAPTAAAAAAAPTSTVASAASGVGIRAPLSSILVPALHVPAAPGLLQRLPPLLLPKPGWRPRHPQLAVRRLGGARPTFVRLRIVDPAVDDDQHRWRGGGGAAGELGGARGGCGDCASLPFRVFEDPPMEEGTEVGAGASFPPAPAAALSPPRQRGIGIGRDLFASNTPLGGLLGGGAASAVREPALPPSSAAAISVGGALMWHQVMPVLKGFKGDLPPQ